ncbi:DUF6607 family protein [Siphonobacter sp. SORGH_AS_1065]|uniref:DUF6607 family protein n=1 Tax=Siphonobacter sp. SORGH_AS_1065 TaxID=3041795 RepID=UPI00278A921F|nr:DUF6607 family protein [Siphonobacter sp. SORGH_AS_1065]MDQ1088627.1 hypothetical protein [Siphonobacter sp. SORGH_AS_1065]
MKRILLTLTLGGLFTSAFAQKSADIQAIKGQCGCHAITFKYAETFSPNPEYKFKERKEMGALEYVFVDEETPNKLVLMHLLVINDSTIIKHWREDWKFQNTDLLAYEKEASWKYKSLPTSEAKGQWSQQVFEVDDSPRYEGSATWFHADGRHVWENTTDAPLPRREYTTRNDYNVMRRGNQIVITDYGYLHDQDNGKILRTPEGEKVIAYEKGINDYHRVKDAACNSAKEWWKTNRTFWVDVRNVWGDLIAQKKGIELEKKVDGKSLNQSLDALASAYLKAPKASAANKAEIKATIQKYLKNKDLIGMK